MFFTDKCVSVTNTLQTIKTACRDTGPGQGAAGAVAAAGAGLPGATALGAERRLSEVRRRAGAEQGSFLEVFLGMIISL